MDIKSGQAESHPTPLALDASHSPGVAPPTQIASNETTQMGPTFISSSGVDFTGDATAAMAAGMSADGARRDHYATTMSPLGGSFGDDLGLPPYGTDGTVAGHWYDPPRSGTPADTA
jgi:hypothetical protein